MHIQTFCPRFHHKMRFLFTNRRRTNSALTSQKKRSLARGRQTIAAKRTTVDKTGPIARERFLLRGRVRREDAASYGARLAAS
jgi:hypothetical protein